MYLTAFHFNQVYYNSNVDQEITIVAAAIILKKNMDMNLSDIYKFIINLIFITIFVTLHFGFVLLN